MADALDDAVAFGREMAIQQLNRQIRGDDRMAKAQRVYISRMADMLSELLKPAVDGDRLVFDADTNMSLGSIGVLTGLLLPAVQSAREAARRMSAMNNLKQIGLAIHNFHAAYKRLPKSHSVDADGKPLLSWRVAILPFIEQQEFYSKFRMSEPWDSPHNIQLLDQMPMIYEDPSVVTAPGETVFHAMVDPKAIFRAGQSTKFRDVIDGTANTLMIAEVDAAHAVPWTKPADVRIDWNDPVSIMGHAHPGGFHVLMADGRVQFVSHNIDVNVFRKMLTSEASD